MKDLFTPYDPALAMKELGFDEPCIMCYYGISRDDKFDGLYLHTGTGKVCNTHLKEEEDGITAPLYSQAFKWFREKYNIQGYIYSSTVRGNSEKTKQFTGYIWNINGIDMPFISTDARDELHDTYEQAELACLIKLIELVKDKSTS